MARSAWEAKQGQGCDGALQRGHAAGDHLISDAWMGIDDSDTPAVHMSNIKVEKTVQALPCNNAVVL